MSLVTNHTHIKGVSLDAKRLPLHFPPCRRFRKADSKTEGRVISQGSHVSVWIPGLHVCGAVAYYRKVVSSPAGYGVAFSGMGMRPRRSRSPSVNAGTPGGCLIVTNECKRIQDVHLSKDGEPTPSSLTEVGSNWRPGHKQVESTRQGAKNTDKLLI